MLDQKTLTAASEEIHPLPLPNERECPFGLSPEIKNLQAKSPVTQVVCPTGITAWMVTGYADVREVLGDPGRFSSQPGQISHVFPGSDPESSAVEGEFPRMDGAEFMRLRRAVSPGMSRAKHMAEFRPTAQRIVDQWIDDLAKTPGPVDFYADVAVPVIGKIATAFFEVPDDDNGFLRNTTLVMLSPDSTADDVVIAGLPLFEYMLDMVKTRRDQPGEDAVSRIIAQGERADRPTTDAELAVTFASLFVGSFDTTAGIASHTLLTLLQHPDQLARLHADPELTGNAVEELLRFMANGVTGLLRRAVHDTEIAGQSVAAGDYVLAVVQTANRDEAFLPDADQLDVTREPTAHLAFGHGPHACIGQQFARLQMNVLFQTLLRRIPTLRLAVPFEQLQFKDRTIVPGPKTLPITWDAVLPAAHQPA
jgi:cytochrome P450